LHRNYGNLLEHSINHHGYEVLVFILSFLVAATRYGAFL